MGDSRARSAESKAWQHLYDYKWKKYRLQFLAENPLCWKCKGEGAIEPATVVHHIKAHRGNRQLFWDPKNHAPSCKTHHDSVEQAEEKGFKRRQIGLDGWPIGED